jgi:peroxiredoxin
MWHMPGHTYSKLKRYADAAWQQEASARVDHAHMIRERILPDQIHNFAHNNEWLIRDWLLVGRVQDAIDLSKNMLSLPRHPVYNSGTGKGSAHFGRMRLQQTCLEYGLWGELLQSRSLLEPNPDDRPAQIVFQSWLAVALLFTDQRGEGTELLRKLRLDRIAAGEKLLALRRSSITGESAVEEGTLASTESPDDEQEVKGEEEKETGDAQKIKTLQKEIKLYREGIARVVAANAVLAKDGKKLEDQLKLAGEIPESLKIEWLHAADLPSRALELAKKSVKDGEGEVLPLAQLAWIQWQAENRESAMENFAKLRKLASGADIDLACFCRLKPLAEADKIEGDWRIAPELAKDLGPRPDLDSLGPVRWSPSLAPSWSAKTSEGEPIECGCFANRPYLLIFYLGFGCLHCMEQLHAIEPHLAKFQEQGIEVVAIGSDSVEDLKKAIEDLDDEHSLSMKLLSGNDLSAFRAFRSYDDFEKRPLHGTLLIDSLGRIRWQDIGHEPFMKIDFLLKETQRLLSPPKGTTEWP